jgi:hypothetical protein
MPLGLYRDVNVQTALNAKLDLPTGTPTGVKFLRDDNTWQNLPSSIVSWGSITGTLSAQTDLWLVLSNKLDLPTGTPDGTKYLRDDNSWQPVVATATWGGITGTLSSQTDLQTALNGKLNTPTGTPDGTKFLRDDDSWQPLPSSGAVWGAITGTLSSQTDLQTALNGKEPTLTKGNLTESTSSVLTITGGTTAVIGTGTTIEVAKATSLTNGYLSSIDWNTFNNKGSGTVTSIATSSPITGGTITSSGTIGIQDAAADGTTKGAATFTASDFNSSSGLISIDYTNGQAASGSTKGFLTSADWTTFNNKGNGTVTSIATSSPITGGTITGSGTIGINNAKADSLTKGAATFKDSDFNDDGAGLINIDYTNGQSANTSTKGFLTSTDWNTFNGKQAALVSGTNIKTVNGTSILGSGDLNTGYTLSVQALTSSPADAQTIYFGNLPKAPVTAAATSKVYIPRAGTIKRAEIYCYSGTAGTAEAWSGYIRLNNTTDTLIATLSVNTNERRFSNTALSIAVVAGDYIEIKFINPTWATNPLTTIFGGYIYIE